MADDKKIPALVHLHYGSVAELVSNSAFPMNMAKNEEQRVKHLVARREDSLKWYGIEGGQAACLAALRDGVPAIEAQIEALLPDLQDSLPRALGHNRARVRGDTGDELDIHAVNAGHCDKAWTRSTRRIKVGTGIVRLVVDIGGNSSQSASRLMWRGIAATLLTRVMEKAGYSVEIVAACAVSGFCYYGNDNEYAAVSTVVKARHGKADIGLLSATVCLPGFFRTQCFAQIVRAADNCGELVDSSLGRYADVAGLLPAEAKVTTLFVPSDVIGKASALGWIKQSVQLLQHSTIDKEGR